MSKKFEEILNFWFGQVDQEGQIEDKYKQQWWMKDDSFDQQVCDQFGEDLQKAINHEYDDWLDEPQGRLALIILLDQFSRNVYRNQAKAYSNDPLAVQIVLEGFELGHHKKLSMYQRAFMIMPLMHQEVLTCQTHCIELFKELQNDVPDQFKENIQGFINAAISHTKIIERFGRYPHRNEILERESTDEEIEFLKDLDSSF